MAKEKASRTRMTDAEVQKYLKHYASKHDLRPGKELEEAVHRCAATRWAALERNAAKAKKPAKVKAKKSAKKVAKVKKAA